MTSAAARRFYDTDDPVRWGRPEMPEEHAITAAWIARESISGPSLELGCGMCSLSDVAPRYTGLDLAFRPLTTCNARRICGDMEQLPIADRSAGFVFSWAALEHVPNPEKVLAEIARVLRPGGLLLLAPAWHCRTWAAEGLEFRPYSDLSLTQKIRKSLIPFRTHVLWRAIFEMPRRAMRELEMLVHAPPFRYKRLRPNLTEYVGTDCDAFTSMDPHAAIVWFAARGWEIVSHPTRRARLMSRHEPVVVRKRGER
ncbi:MAG TPA: class I SAM-dependent methyltransferase [Thermoanaerobaculia bacterium]|jgi:SAM-dependent methyltransferase